MQNNEIHALSEMFARNGGLANAREIDVNESDLVPLDQGTADELHYLMEAQSKYLLSRWRDGWHPGSLPAELEPVEKEWRAGLDEQRVAAYCAATSSFITRILFDAIVLTGDEDPNGRIESVKESPYLEVLARPGSPLARREGVKDGDIVRIGIGMFAQHIALRCQVPLAWGELAWRFLAANLAEADSVLPGLDIRPTGDGAFEVSRRSTEG